MEPMTQTADLPRPAVSWPRAIAWLIRRNLAQAPQARLTGDARHTSPLRPAPRGKFRDLLTAPPRRNATSSSPRVAGPDGGRAGDRRDQRPPGQEQRRQT